MKCVVLGAGAWGKAFASVLQQSGHQVTLVDRHQPWPDQPFELGFLALPAQVTRARLIELRPPVMDWVSLSKGIEIESGLRMSQVLSQVTHARSVAALSGPCLAHEVVLGLPTAVVVASENVEFAARCQEVIQQKTFRTYRSEDLAGVELSGALKNIFAIAAGVCAGLQVGENALASLVTRSLVEMGRIGEAMGGRRETFGGLAGVGDLMLTCYSGTSRNHRVGQELAEGKNLKEILERMHQVAEGVPTTEAIYRTARAMKIKAPILAGVHGLLYEGKTPQQAAETLLSREAGSEA